MAGRFKIVKKNLHIKEVFVGEGAGKCRFVVAFNPEQAEHDRQKNPERIRVELEALEKQTGKTHLKTKYTLLAQGVEVRPAESGSGQGKVGREAGWQISVEHQ